jgi:hypothetical protein
MRRSRSGLNVFSGGDGSSRIASPAEGKWAMSPDELRRYGSAMLAGTKPCAFEMWRYESPDSEFKAFQYFRRPEISAAMDDLAALAAKAPPVPAPRRASSRVACASRLPCAARCASRCGPRSSSSNLL